MPNPPPPTGLGITAAASAQTVSTATLIVDRISYKPSTKKKKTLPPRKNAPQVTIPNDARKKGCEGEKQKRRRGKSHAKQKQDSSVPLEQQEEKHPAEQATLQNERNALSNQLGRMRLSQQPLADLPPQHAASRKPPQIQTKQSRLPSVLPLAQDADPLFPPLPPSQCVAHSIPPQPHPLQWAVYWDLENVAVPRGVTGHRLVHALRTRLTAIRPGAIVRIVAAGNLLRITVALRNQLQASGVSLMHVETRGRKDAADKALIAELCLLPVEHPPPFGVVLLSGDSDFAYALARITHLGYFTVVVATGRGRLCGSLLRGVCNIVWGLKEDVLERGMMQDVLKMEGVGSKNKMQVKEVAALKKKIRKLEKIIESQRVGQPTKERIVVTGEGPNGRKKKPYRNPKCTRKASADAEVGMVGRRLPELVQNIDMRAGVEELDEGIPGITTLLLRLLSVALAILTCAFLIPMAITVQSVNAEKGGGFKVSKDEGMVIFASLLAVSLAVALQLFPRRMSTPRDDSPKQRLHIISDGK